MEQVLPVQENISRAANMLRAGGVIAHATETCYGLACDLTSRKAVEKLFRIKDRSFDQPVSGLFRSIDHAREYADFSPEALSFAEENLPGPFTIVVPLKEEAKLYPTLRDWEQGAGNWERTIGIRISAYSLVQELIRNIDFPIVTTSANVHGQENPYSAEEIVNQFIDRLPQPDLILDSGTIPKNPPSTVVIFGEGGMKTIR